MTKPDKKAQEADITQEVKDQAQEAAKPKADAGEDLQVKLAETKDALMRALADSENTRKRAVKEIEDANKYGITTIAKDLISVLENLQRTLENIPPEQKQNEPHLKNLFEGVSLTSKELLGIFERRGIKRVEPKPGEKFDHNYHQAVAQLEDHKFEPGAVIQVVQAGYVIHDRLLRPAMVTVSKGAPQQARVDTTA